MYLEVRCEAELAAHPDEPFGRVVLVPLDGVAEVHRELVVEIVVTLANRHKLQSTVSILQYRLD